MTAMADGSTIFDRDNFDWGLLVRLQNGVPVINGANSLNGCSIRERRDALMIRYYLRYMWVSLCIQSKTNMHVLNKQISCNII